MLKSFPSQLVALTRHRGNRRNLRVLLRFLLVLLGMIALYSVLFHVLMLREGQDHTWITGLYWTLTVMSTLGFGDITFHTDLGRLFSILVLLSGMVFLLILLPFTFIEFFYEPWVKARLEQKTPRGVDDEVTGHVILTHADPLAASLVRRLENLQVPHVLVIREARDAQDLQDHGFQVAVGELDEAETWRRVGVERAALVLATGAEVLNSSIAFTVREVTKSVPVAVTAQSESAVDVLELAGASHVLRLEQMMGQALARRTRGGDTGANIIGHVDGVLIAEASAQGTPLVGRKLSECRLREDFGVAVAGVWRRGRFEGGRAETVIEESTVLVLAGDKQQIGRYDAHFGMFREADAPVLIIGGGRVGRATAKALGLAGHDYRIVDKDPARIVPDSKRHFLGDGADLAVLKAAGIEETQAVVITSHLDDVNVFLTLYCRKLRPDVQILARATQERNVGALHRAGADVVLSYSSMGSNAVLNLMRRGEVLMLAEGLDVFRVQVPEELDGKMLAECGIREDTSCSVVAVRQGEEMRVVPGPEHRLRQGDHMLLIGTLAAEEAFLEQYPDAVLPGEAGEPVA